MCKGPRTQPHFCQQELSSLGACRGLPTLATTCLIFLYAAYLTRLGSVRKRMVVVMNWLTTLVFGRDMSRCGGGSGEGCGGGGVLQLPAWRRCTRPFTSIPPTRLLAGGELVVRLAR